MGRWGEASEVADLALFLALDAARFINGALIPVDGGETAGALLSHGQRGGSGADGGRDDGQGHP